MAINDIFEKYNKEKHGAGIEEIMFIKSGVKCSNIKEAMLATGFKKHEIDYISNYAASANIDLRKSAAELGIGSQDKMSAAMAFSKGMPWLSSIKAKYLNLTNCKKYAIMTRFEQPLPPGIPIAFVDNVLIFAVSNIDNISEIKMSLKNNGISNDVIYCLTLESIIAMLYRREILDTESDVKKTIEKRDYDNVRPLLDGILIHAAFHGASDIHGTSLPNGGVIELRLDGVKNLFVTLDTRFYRAIINIIINALGQPDFRMKVEGRLPEQNIPLALRGRFEFRVEVMATVFGPALTMRVFNLSGETTDIESLGFDDEDLIVLRKYANSGSGMVFAVGPTGSGKTTALYASMKIIDATRVSIQSVENPAEMRVGIWRQHQLIHESNMSEHEEWVEWNKGLLRTDPDVVLQGEVRDGKLLAAVLDMANTGHLVYTTLHADSAPLAIARIRQMRSSDGSPIDMDMFSSLTLGIIALRLLRRLCDTCKEVDDNHEVITKLEEFNFDSTNIYKPCKNGCEMCHYTGYRGRLLIYEILDFNRKLKDMILNEKTRTIDIEDSMIPQKTLIGRAFKYVSNGLTGIDEVYRTLKR